MDLKEEISTETNHIEEPESEIDIDASFNLSEKDKEKGADKLPEIYKLIVPFLSTLKVDSSVLKSSPLLELKSPLVTPEYTCLELSNTLPAPIVSNSTPNIKTQFMSILEEQIEEILNKQEFVNGFVNYLPKIKNRIVNYFLEFGNKILKFIINYLLEIGNLKR